MKNTMTVESAVAGNAQTDNVLSGKRFERSPYPAFLSLYQSGSSSGLLAELNVGGRSIIPPDPVNSQNRIPVVPDDLVIDGVEVMQGELIQLTVRNTTAGALTYRGRVELEEAQYGG